MREILILAGRHLRSMVRTRAAMVLGLVYVLGMLAAIWLPGGDAQVGGTIVLATLLGLTLLVFGVSAGIGGVLPADRRAGRNEWLFTTAPPAWKHRVAVVVAGWFLAVCVGAAGGLASGLASTMWAGDFELRDSELLPVPPPHDQHRAHVTVSDSADTLGAPWTLSLPAGRGTEGALVEIETRPLYNRSGLSDYVHLNWSTDRGKGTDITASVWVPLRIRVPRGATALTLRVRGTRVGVRVRRARLLRPGHPPALGLIWAGLLLGLMAGAAAPIAVLVSRFTSGATAGGAAFVLLLYGAVKAPMFGFLDRIPIEGAVAYAMDVLRIASLAAPDLDLIQVIGENAAGRTLSADILMVLPPILLYQAIGTLLAAVPVPAQWAEGELS